MEKAELIRREKRRTAAGDWNSNIYRLDGLVKRIAEMETEFTKAREARKKLQEESETPVGLRKDW